MNDWPFDQPKDCATIVSRVVMEGKTVITYVSHDEDDGGWQFLDDQTTDVRQAALVSLAGVVEMDPSVLQIADLPPGWIAVRQDAQAVWTCQPNEQMPDDE